MSGWLGSLTNAQRRYHHKAQDPDKPHPYYPRHVVDRQRIYFTRDPVMPCRVCGGSPLDRKHL